MININKVAGRDDNFLRNCIVQFLYLTNKSLFVNISRPLVYHHIHSITSISSISKNGIANSDHETNIKKTKIERQEQTLLKVVQILKSKAPRSTQKIQIQYLSSLILKRKILSQKHP